MNSSRYWRLRQPFRTGDNYEEIAEINERIENDNSSMFKKFYLKKYKGPLLSEKEFTNLINIAKLNTDEIRENIKKK
jgi:hypothetical protein